MKLDWKPVSVVHDVIAHSEPSKIHLCRERNGSGPLRGIFISPHHVALFYARTAERLKSPHVNRESTAAAK